MPAATPVPAANHVAGVLAAGLEHHGDDHERDRGDDREDAEHPGRGHERGDQADQEDEPRRPRAAHGGVSGRGAHARTVTGGLRRPSGCCQPGLATRFGAWSATPRPQVLELVGVDRVEPTGSRVAVEVRRHEVDVGSAPELLLGVEVRHAGAEDRSVGADEPSACGRPRAAAVPDERFFDPPAPPGSSNVSGSAATASRTSSHVAMTANYERSPRGPRPRSAAAPRRSRRSPPGRRPRRCASRGRPRGRRAAAGPATSRARASPGTAPGRGRVHP